MAFPFGDTSFSAQAAFPFCPASASHCSKANPMVALKALSLGLLASQAWAVPTASHTALTSPAASDAAVAAAAAKLEQLSSYALDQTLANLPSSSEDKQACTRETLRIRRDWRAFSKPEKKDYIDSVLCLQKLPSRTPSHIAPGAKTRYDDFLATHINQTLEIHYTVHVTCPEIYPQH